MFIIMNMWRGCCVVVVGWMTATTADDVDDDDVQCEQNSAEIEKKKRKNL